MIFHRLRLFLGGAQRVPRSDAEIAAAAARIGLPIPEECRPGVAANLALLDRHAATLRGGAGKRSR